MSEVKRTTIGTLVKRIAFGIIALFILITVFSAFDRNTEGRYVIRQSARGKVEVVNEPVFYWALWAKTWTYEESFEIYLSSSSEDGGDEALTNPIAVTFSDKAIADVSTVTKVMIPANDDIRLQLHKEFKSMDAVRRYARSYVESVLKTSGTFYKGTEAYSTKRPEFEVTIRSQLIDGKYKSTTSFIEEDTGEKDADGNPIVVKTPTTVIATENGLPNGVPLISDKGFFNRYGIEIRDFQLKSVDPDANTLGRINREKDIEQDRRIAIQEAETAKQDAITAAEKGKALVAKAEAEQLVLKKEAVIKAEKEAEVARIQGEQKLTVAELAAKEAIEEANARLTRERAEAESNKLKVQAGLTPQQELEGRKYIANVVSRNIADGIAKADYPEVVISGGSGENGGDIDLMKMLGIQLATDMADKYSSPSK